MKKVQKVSLKEGEDLFKVRARNTLFSIGKLYHMSVSEIKELNRIVDILKENDIIE